ncbi:FAD-binding oxidoreductase [Ponticoccus litoralis]|uniref:FAD-linked oxidase C-terminal domain-containing protein n=1 Tax=Ponticoccus litoralis TaxID=422297 RepID=A0AAW9SK60_9RHOB
MAHSEAQRAEMWARREAAVEVSLSRGGALVNDVAVPLDAVETFLTEAGARCRALDPDVQEMVVAHLGDGNVHYTLWPSGAAEGGALIEAVEEVVRAPGGSFSAEHGIGLHKKASMARHRDPVALEVMRAVKTALDPKGILNPGKVLP